ncbi:prepilin-type N-terminal cleavage/methylation domain-containing protein [Pseudomonas coleopterorum]|uniref:Prepilin-type N-terminal cleavage/methylation domain-containing protein n=1 Tax=Pseudomonas coleopterorum TaxID=1605838 RepID=A0ABR9C0L2_9PSED|nr:prepilin-type N-terminal cleavage/methylation domain-containing protein [Pseudomonas coleopterorum]MBD8757699.1 prepilin-type N-terminal cleavage/methylation domain-containing protein [Pseudomonas coleopterorum]MBD8770747.1 prepilin-type N-terminal cleavage/methylation domain-containing protein [Pseudomonas coleopterorum]
MIGQRGFTLLEMLAALLILALCSTVLVMAFGNSARALQQAQRSDELSLAARSILDEASAGQLQAGSTEGRWSGLPWRLAISTLPAGEAPVDVWRLDLRVGQGARQAEYSTLQVRSRASGANR